jgi:hypothetical protein
MESVESIFVNSALEILNLSSNISLEIGDYEGVVLAIMSSVSLGKDENSAGFSWANAAEARLPDGAAKDAAKEALERVKKRWHGEPQPGDYNPDPLWQIIQKIALTMNVDISDEKSAFVRRLRIAARDNDPERFLRFCENIVITFGSISGIDRKIAQTLAIDTSSNKVVHCRKFNLHEESTDGDSAFAKFTKQHCDSCTSRIPRPDDWSYTKEIREELEKENLAFVKAAFAEGKGMRFVDKDDLE